MCNLFRIFTDGRKQEIEELQTQLHKERSKNLKDIKLLNKKIRAIITSGEVELIIKNIDDIRKGK